jgi:hypothetical protein
MPEIWLRYGTTDVVLDIKFENLASQVGSSFAALPEDEVKNAVNSVPLTDNMLVLALSSSKAAGKTVAMLAEAARAKGFAFTIDVPGRIAGSLRTNLAGDETLSINRVDYSSLHERVKKFQSAVVVSNVVYDPLFGFGGAPAAILRHLHTDKMAEAFGARKGNTPAPGIEGEPLKVALSAVEGVPATSIELVAGGSGISGVHTGSIAEAFGKAVAQLKSISEVEVDPAKCAVISASSEAGTHSTLAGSLNSLWNSIHAVKEGGSAILVAENREGIGGGALQMFVEGRLKPEQVMLSPYVDGLEHLIYIQELRQKYELGLVSTLPHYYARSKLGFSTYAGMKDIIEKLPEKYGKNFRALVMLDADIIMPKPRA